MGKLITQRFKGLKRGLKVFVSCVLIVLLATTYVIKTSGDPDFSAQNPLVVNDITNLNPIHVATVVEPTSIAEVVKALKATEGTVSIGGGRYSQGGQTALEGSLHLDMRKLDKVVDLDVGQKEVTVQAGITWRKLQEAIDTHNLSIRIMQTYSNFTVGGSLSVNVHGRYIGEGPLIRSVKSIKLVLADGDVVTASRDNNSELFAGAIGGYGGLGVIVEATLYLTENIKIERRTSTLNAEDYLDYFQKNIDGNSEIIFHNGDLYPPDYNELRDVSWYKSSKRLTIEDRLIPKDMDYSWNALAAEFVSDYDLGKWLRQHVLEPAYYTFDRVVWRNWEASYDVRELATDDTEKYAYVLREYFVPVKKFSDFVPKMKKVFLEHDVNVINVSVRHALADTTSYLSWAPVDSFAFVVYFRQARTEAAKTKVKAWSRALVDQVLSVNGSYYLPYQIYATQEQFLKAYPRFNELVELKNRVDPSFRFNNKFWDARLNQSADMLSKKENVKQYSRGEEQTLLTIPEWYLVFNPKEYADFLDNGKNPSDFPFMASINMYWVLYDRTQALTRDVYPINDEYNLMLNVIGISTTVEYLIKAAYENSIGRLTRWSAGGQDTEEDIIYRQAQRAYSDLIYEKAWYEFDFWSWVSKAWSEPNFFGKNMFRKLERKLFITMEFGFKTLYAKLIGMGAQTAYEASDGRIYLLAKKESSDGLPEDVINVTRDGDLHLLSLPRWGGFTEALPKLVNAGYSILEISGNRNVAISVLHPNATPFTISSGNILFSSAEVTEPNVKRTVFLVSVARLKEFFDGLIVSGLTLEHVYDY